VIYGLSELAFVLVVIGMLTAPLWGTRLFDWMTRPFGVPRENERDDRNAHDDPA
jgi:hypothetical protein